MGICSISTLLYWPNPISSQCLPNIKLSSQLMVDQFAIDHGACDTIKGNLEISGSDITDLNSLSKVTVVEGYLHIHQCPELQSIMGLQHIQSIGNSLALVRNARLQSLDALENLRSIGLHLNLVGNIQLSNIEGLLNLDSINGGLTIVDNPKLQSLQGLNKIESLGGLLEISYCDEISNLVGLDEIHTIGSHLYIYKMKSLESLQGLESLQIVGGDLEISENQLLSGLDNLERLTSVAQCFDLYRNPSLTSIEGLHSLHLIGGALIIIQNKQLDQCAVEELCQHLLNPPSTVSIWGNGSVCSSPSDFLAACAATSAKNLEATRIRSFPNPTSGQIKIHGLGNRVHAAQLFNSFGSLVRKLSVTGQNSIDLSDLPSGHYYLKVASKQQYYLSLSLSKL